MKPCVKCGADFWCVPSRDEGSGNVRKYCSPKCRDDDKRFTVEKSVQVFWSRVEKNGPNGCWLYMAGRDKWGYGDLRYMGKHIQAHRFAWLLEHGDPGELDVLHRCDNPPCCNTAHLFLGTDADNVADMVAKGRQKSHSKLKADDVLAIRARFKRVDYHKSNAAELAREYGISAIQIRNVANGTYWKHIK